MSDLDGIEALDDQAEALGESLSQAAGMAANFDSELKRVNAAFAATGAGIAGLERGLSKGLRRAFDGVIFDGKNTGCGLLKDGLIASAALVEQEPEVVQAVVNAVLEGWTMAFDDAARAVAACLAVRPDRTAPEEEAQLAAIRALSLTGATLTEGLGFPDPAHMDSAVTAMRELGEAVPATEGLRDARFWQAAPEAFRRTGWEA